MLSEKLLEKILDRFGLHSRPESDVAGLATVYAAWCASMPFDNIGKMIALRSGSSGELPGLDGERFFKRWLEHGISGTCWPSSNALFELLFSLGFNARRVAGSMRDTGIISHGSVKVQADGGDWLVDSAMLTNVPVPLTGEIYIPEDSLFGAEVDPGDGTYMIWADLPPNPTFIPCRLLVDPASREFYADRYEASRLRSPFNQRLFARKNRPDERLVLNANVRVSKTRRGMDTCELDASELCESLRDEFGVSGEMIEQWRAAGALDATFEPPSGPPPAAIMALPPSQRRHENRLSTGVQT